MLCNHVSSIVPVSPLPLEDIQRGKEDSKDDDSSQIHGECVQGCKLPIIDIILITCLGKSEHCNKVGSI